MDVCWVYTRIFVKETFPYISVCVCVFAISPKKKAGDMFFSCHPKLVSTVW